MTSIQKEGSCSPATNVEEASARALRSLKSLGREYFVVDEGEVSLDPTEPPRVNRGMHEGQSAIAVE